MSDYEQITRPEGIPPVQEPPRKHYARWVAVGLGALLVAFTAVGVAGAVSGGGHPVPGPTVTATVVQHDPASAVPAPSVTRTVNVRVTQTVAPPALTVGRYSGSGSWNSPQFTVAGFPLTVTYSYSGNGSDGTADNFAADVTDGNLDDLSIANDIAYSGGKTTTLYPSGAGTYHLEVTATGDWSFTISQPG